ncbi:MAG: LuxR C-terminal-related transcriptional regulator [Paludibacteraceae bacterium]
MKHYIAYFEKVINRIACFVLLFYSLGALIDILVGNPTYPEWIYYSSVPIGILSFTCFLLSVFRIISFRIGFLICSYGLIVFFYVAGFIDPPVNQTAVLYYFSTLGVCMSCLFFSGLTGLGKHVLYLGVLNALLYVSLLIFFSLFLNISVIHTLFENMINVTTFIALPLIVYILFRYINASIIENEENKKRLEEAEKEILRLTIDEENRRNHCLATMQESNLQLLDKLKGKFDALLAKKIESRNDFAAEIQEMKNLCHIYLSTSRNSESSRWQQHANTDFISRLRVKYPQLSVKEQYICSLVWALLSTKEIADQMNISVEGVKWHRKQIRRKMQLENDMDLHRFLDDIRSSEN